MAKAGIAGPARPHAEIEALARPRKNGGAAGSTLYVTLEPCCTHGRTPPCTEAIMAAGIRRVVAAAAIPIRPIAAGGSRFWSGPASR